jgi:hypothetical protein
MKRIFYSLVFSVFFALTLVGSAAAQSSTFSDKNVEYTFDLPESTWKMIVKPTAAEPRVEYVYGDRLNGYLQIRKVTLKEGKTLADAIQEVQQKQEFKLGYVAGKEEPFAGALKGKIFNYEFVDAGGKNMSGRIYFLKADDTTVYFLHFTGLRDQLRPIRNQIDSIARTFKVKAE